jgi:hypothetical protein
MSFDPSNRSLKIQESIGTPIPKVEVYLRMRGLIFSFSRILGNVSVIPGLHSWPAPFHAIALVVNPKARVVTFITNNSNTIITINLVSSPHLHKRHSVWPSHADYYPSLFAIISLSLNIVTTTNKSFTSNRWLHFPQFTLSKNMALTFQLNNFLFSFPYNFFFYS